MLRKVLEVNKNCEPDAALSTVHSVAEGARVDGLGLGLGLGVGMAGGRGMGVGLGGGSAGRRE